MCYRVVVKNNTLYSIPFDTATTSATKSARSRPSSATPFGSYNPVLNPDTARSEARHQYSGIPSESAGSVKRLVPYVRVYGAFMRLGPPFVARPGVACSAHTRARTMQATLRWFGELPRTLLLAMSASTHWQRGTGWWNQRRCRFRAQVKSRFV
jgi:hypothetical protein